MEFIQRFDPNQCYCASPREPGPVSQEDVKQFSRLSQLCPKETPGAAALCVSFGCNTLVVFVCASVSE